MTKVAIVTDSNSGITQSEAKELGITVLPMPFMIGDEEYFEGKNLTEQWFYEQQRADVDISSSQPAPGAVTQLWTQLLETFDQVLHIPMTSGLSGSCGTALGLKESFGGRVEVADNHRISVPQKHCVHEAVELAKKGMDALGIRKLLEKAKDDSSIYITVDTLKYLKKGGRITPAVAAIGTFLRIKPVLQIQGEKLDTFCNARTMSQAKKIMIKALRDDIENRFGGLDAHDVYIDIAYTNNRGDALIFRDEIEEAIPGYKVGFVDPLALSIGCHTGEGVLACAATRRLHTA